MTHRLHQGSLSPSLMYSQNPELADEWRGKTSPAARRKIQNRLNQRAYRERQRMNSEDRSSRSASQSASPASSYKSLESPTSPHRRLQDGKDADARDQRQMLGSPRADATPVPAADLTLLIRNNVLHAAAQNASHLGIQLDPRSTTQLPSSDAAKRCSVPSLRPVRLQYLVPHDPVLDILPDAQLRHNIISTLAAGKLNEQVLCAEIRNSGTLVAADSMRCGFVVWGAPEQPASWEMSEYFVRRWRGLLSNCENMLAATNQWRARRGEAALRLD